MMDSFGILEAAHKRVKRQGAQVSGPSLEKALRRVCFRRNNSKNLVPV